MMRPHVAPISSEGMKMPDEILRPYVMQVMTKYIMLKTTRFTILKLYSSEW